MAGAAASPLGRAAWRRDKDEKAAPLAPDLGERVVQLRGSAHFLSPGVGSRVNAA